jgi:hypothetical protein
VHFLAAAQGTTTVDLNHIVAAIQVDDGAVLELDNLEIINSAAQTGPNVPRLEYVDQGLATWPSLVAAPGAEVGLG